MTSLHGSTEFYDTYLHPIYQPVIKKSSSYPYQSIYGFIQKDKTCKKFFFMMEMVSRLNIDIFTNCTIFVVPDQYLKDIDVTLIDSYSCLRIIKHHIIPIVANLRNIVNYKTNTLNGDTISIKNTDVLRFKEKLDGNIVFINNLKTPEYYF